MAQCALGPDTVKKLKLSQPRRTEKLVAEAMAIVIRTGPGPHLNHDTMFLTDSSASSESAVSASSEPAGGDDDSLSSSEATTVSDSSDSTFESDSTSTTSSSEYDSPPMYDPQRFQATRWPRMPHSEQISHSRWDNLKRYQETDEFLAKLMAYIKDGTKPQNARDELVVIKLSPEFLLTERGILAKIVPAAKGKHTLRVCIPKVLVPHVARLCHNTPWSAHLGVNASIHVAQQHFWWPRMSTDMMEHIRACSTCAMHKAPCKKPIMPLGTTNVPNKIWQVVHVDHWTVGNTPEGYKGVLAFIDAFSKYVVMEPVKDYTSELFAQVFMNRVASVYGAPKALVSDQGSAFTGHYAQELFRATGVTHRQITVRRPQANGQAERIFRTFRNMTATVCHEDRETWPDMIPHMTFAYNSTYHRAIDNTPFFLMFGRDPTFRLRPEDIELGGEEDTLQDTIVKVERARELAKQQIYKERKKQRDHYDAKVAKFYRNSRFSIGQLVWLQRGTPQAGTRVPKLAPRFVGPFRITWVGDRVVRMVEVNHPERPERQVHFDFLRPCHSRPVNPLGEESVNQYADDPNVESSAGDPSDS